MQVIAVLLLGTACTRACGPLVPEEPGGGATVESDSERAGQVRGRIIVTDNRAGLLSSGADVALQKALVTVTPVDENPDGGPSYINPTFFAVTNEDGRFDATWIDETGQGLPVKLRITTFLQSSDVGGGIIAPPVTFEVSHVSGAAPSSTTFHVVGDLDVDIGDIVLQADDDTAAYLTTREMFDRIVTFSSILRERMPGLVVKTEMTGLIPAAGFAPTVHEVQVASLIPQASPLVLAHEIGHAFTWAALNLEFAPLNPLSDYGLDFHWSLDSREPSKAAFLEGMAQFWSLVWMFGSNANAIIGNGEKFFDVELARVSQGGAVILDCAKVSNAHEIPFCHTAALRDLIDNDGSGGDGVDLTLAFIINTLNAFPDGCGDNGCRDEGGWDALNHLDFLRNTPQPIHDQILGVYRGNGVDGGN